MNKNQDVRGNSVSASANKRRLGLGQLLTCAALLCLVASADADQLQVTGANFSGNAVYDLGISPSSTTPIKPLIASTTTLINNSADEATHGGFDALVWVPNSICKSLDLIAADATKSQIVRYAGASTVAGCYTPVNGTPSVSPTAQILFKWTKVGSGPALPNGVSADASGNLFVVSSVGSFDSKPSVWVLPFNTSANLYCSGAAGVYCAPVLVDNKFGGTYTLALAETLVAGTAATTSTHTVLWSAGDLLVLVGDSFDARLLVYSHAQLYTSGGLINLHALPLSGPNSTPIPWAKFLAELAAPFGMDLWPATTPGTNASVLFTTIDGRILRFDTVQNKFVTDFADRLGPGLQKIRVGSYANIPYAFVAQLEAKNTGQILVFGAPPASGANNPLAAVSKNVMNPVGLAVTNSASQSLPTAPHGTTPCAPPNAPCVIAPLGPELVSTITAYPGDNLSGTVVEQNCIVQVDPRVMGSGASWTCSNAPALPIGAGTSYCPSFPAAVIPGSVCGHSGPTGAGFAVIEGTATGIDPNLNNSFIVTAGNIDAVLPGATNLECSQFVTGQIPGQIPLMAWGTRSDLTTVEGVIPEDSQFGSPLGGSPGYLTELTGTCDTSTSGSRELSIFAIGLGLSYTDQSGVYTLQNQKYEALQQTVTNAAITNNPPPNPNPNVKSTLTADLTKAENYVTTAQGAAFPSTTFTNNINCALNEIAATDSFLRANLPAFSSNLVTLAPGGGNENPAGDIDGRLANWYTALNTMLAGNAPYATWPIMPASSVPVCVTSGPYTLSATISGYTKGYDLQAANVVTLDTIIADNSPTGNGTFSFQEPLYNGDRYGIQLAEPQGSGQVCTVLSGDSGTVNGGNPPNVVISCSTTSQATIGDFGTVPFTTAPPPAANYFYFNSANTSNCVITSIDLYEAEHEVDITGSYEGLGNVLYAAPLPTGSPGYGYDTETITCYGIGEGATPAFSGPQIISDPGLPAPTLAITSFSVDSNPEDENFGNLSWMTSGGTITNGVPNTTCALMSEFSGDASTVPLAQNPVTGLPVNSAGYAYPWDQCLAFFDGLGPDNVTLTCSDPTAGMAAVTIAVDLSGGCNIE
jgi:hypothetical protein